MPIFLLPRLMQTGRFPNGAGPLHRGGPLRNAHKPQRGLSGPLTSRGPSQTGLLTRRPASAPTRPRSPTPLPQPSEFARNSFGCLHTRAKVWGPCSLGLVKSSAGRPLAGAPGSGAALRPRRGWGARTLSQRERGTAFIPPLALVQERARERAPAASWLPLKEAAPLRPPAALGPPSACPSTPTRRGRWRLLPLWRFAGAV